MTKVNYNEHGSSWLPGPISSILLNKEPGAKWLPQTLIVENRITSDEKRGKGFYDGCFKCLGNKKVVWIIILYAIVATGLWSVFLGNPFGFGRGEQLGKLKEQVDILDEEVENLEDQVDRLGSELNRLSNETDRLEDINDELFSTASDLNSTVHLLSELNDSFNASLSDQQHLGDLLEDSVSKAESVNIGLIASISTLQDRIATLSNLNEDFKTTSGDLQEERELYRQITQSLNSTTEHLGSDIESLQHEVDEMQTQNKILATNNAELRSILTFLNQAGIDLNSTVQTIEDYLAEEIIENGNLVLRDLELSYQNIYFYWLCTSSFEDIFGSKAWMTNKNQAIGISDYTSALQFVNINVLQKLCASKNDFENFVVSDNYIGYQGQSPPTQISFNTLNSAIERYSTKLIAHYFPSEEDNGLTATDWKEAKYECKNIPNAKRYVWVQD